MNSNAGAPPGTPAEEHANHTAPVEASQAGEAQASEDANDQDPDDHGHGDHDGNDDGSDNGRDSDNPSEFGNHSDLSNDSDNDYVYNFHEEPETEPFAQPDNDGAGSGDLFTQASDDHATIHSTVYVRQRTGEDHGSRANGDSAPVETIVDSYVLAGPAEDVPANWGRDSLFRGSFQVLERSNDDIPVSEYGPIPNYQLFQIDSEDSLRSRLFDDHLKTRFLGFPDRPFVLHACLSNNDTGEISAHYSPDWRDCAQVVRIYSPCFNRLFLQQRVLTIGDRSVALNLPAKYSFIYDGRNIHLVIREETLEQRVRKHASDRFMTVNRNSIPLSTAFAVWGLRFGVLPLACRNEIETVWRSMAYLADELYRRSTLGVPTALLDRQGLEILAVRLHRRRIDYHGRIMYRSSGPSGVHLEGRLVSVELIDEPLRGMRIRTVIEVTSDVTRFHLICLRHSADEFRRFGWYFSNRGDDPSGTYYGVGIDPLREWVPGKIIYQQRTSQGPLTFVVADDNTVNVHVDDKRLHSLLWSHHSSYPWPVRRYWPLTSLVSLFRQSVTHPECDQQELSTLVHRIFQLEVDRMALLQARDDVHVHQEQFVHHQFAVEMFRRSIMHEKSTIKTRTAVPQPSHAECAGTLYNVVPRLNHGVFSLECYFLYWSQAHQTTFGLMIEALEWRHLDPFVDFEAVEISMEGEEVPPYWDPRCEHLFNDVWRRVPLPTPTTPCPPPSSSVPFHIPACRMGALLRPLARALEANCFPAKADNVASLVQAQYNSFCARTQYAASTPLILQILAQFTAWHQTQFIDSSRRRRLDLYNNACAAREAVAWDDIRRQREALVESSFEPCDVLLLLLLEVVVGWVFVQHDKHHMLPSPANHINWTYTLSPTMDEQVLSNLVLVLQTFTTVFECEHVVEKVVPVIMELDIDPASGIHTDEWYLHWRAVREERVDRLPSSTAIPNPAEAAATASSPSVEALVVLAVPLPAVPSAAPLPA
ncbi:hypothetical protein G647_10296 [Cladophialophora carrionii CBS 160.54]|uniref:Uncharacterized protein n=1 Tax=Cladophialophora carrionii CBS 160.54 TaxID=1279043 RepID=V9DJ09_9EURO|nr:uncharacterized protein G647_10296 [Cladophialophora carrionii CBS 160.54]ETI26850.1 hypothetical protein G647_10296 [Cladophialophora carrionii CBS 160.54]